MSSHQNYVIKCLMMRRSQIHVEGNGTIDDVLHPEATIIAVQKRESTQEVPVGYASEKINVNMLKVVGSRPRWMGRKAFEVDVHYKERNERMQACYLRDSINSKMNMLYSYLTNDAPAGFIPDFDINRP